MAGRAARHSTRGSGKDLVSLYVEAAKAIPEVQMILIQDPATEDARIWTVISAPPFESKYRRRIYDTERAALQQVRECLADFRLINIQEIEDQIEDVLPTGHQVLFRREISTY